MVRRHLTALAVAVALGLVAASSAALVAPSPAGALQSQTIEFTSPAPQGKDWYTSQNFIFGFQYLAQASASSGLPVTYSIAPTSAGVCSIKEVFSDDPYFPPGAAIRFDGGGICTVQADQPGDADHAPAPQAAQTFVIERVPTWIDRVRAKRGLPGHVARFSARLKTWRFVSSMWIGIEPFDGEPVTFTIAGRPVCTGTTGSDGIATCAGTLLKSELTRVRFTATYAGTDDYKPVSASAFFALG